MDRNRQIINEQEAEEHIIPKMMNTLTQIVNPAIQVYTIAEVAEILKCKERAVKHHLYESRDLPYLKVGREVRIRYEDVKSFMDNQLKIYWNQQES